MAGGGWGGGEIPTSNFVISTHAYVASEKIPFSAKVCLILLISAGFLEKISIFKKNGTFTQGNSVIAVLEIF